MVEQVLSDVELKEACTAIIHRNVKRWGSGFVREREHTPRVARLANDERLDVSSIDTFAMFVDRDVRELNLHVDGLDVDLPGGKLVAVLIGKPSVVRVVVGDVVVTPIRFIVPKCSR